MAAPVNQTALTAIDVGTLPASISQDVRDAGTTYTVWYKYTAVTGDTVIGIFGYGGAGSYFPDTNVFIGPAAAPVAYLVSSANNIPIQIPVTVGETYYFEFAQFGGDPAILTLEIEQAPDTTVPIGSIFVNDDTVDFPVALISGTTDNTVLKFVTPFPNGEGGDVLPAGNILIDDIENSEIKLYNYQLVLQQTLSIASSDSKIRACIGGNKFYVGIGTNPVTVKTVSYSGVFGGTTFTLTANTTIKGIAANEDETILYFSNNTGGGALKQWNLLTDTAMSDLVAGVGTRRIGDILVLTDGAIIFLTFDGVRDTNVFHYNAAGVLQTTYPFGTGRISTIPRLAYAIDNPNSFWIWYHPIGTNGLSRFDNIKVSDGSVLSSVDHIEYEGGKYQGDVTATPIGRFGISFSCPFFLMRVAISPYNLASGIYIVEPDKTFDELYTEDVNIPDPTIKTGLIGN